MIKFELSYFWQHELGFPTTWFLELNKKGREQLFRVKLCAAHRVHQFCFFAFPNCKLQTRYLKSQQKKQISQKHHHQNAKSVIWQIFTGRIELFQQATISGVENSVFCPCAVLVIMLAKEFELVQSAQTKSLCQQEKKPVDLPLLFCNDGLHTITLMAQGTIKESRDHPMLRRTIVQWMLVLHEVSVQLCKHFLQTQDNKQTNMESTLLCHPFLHHLHPICEIDSLKEISRKSISLAMGGSFAVVITITTITECEQKCE